MPHNKGGNILPVWPGRCYLSDGVYYNQDAERSRPQEKPSNRRTHPALVRPWPDA